jgi:para-aminobenzoate synthetase component I
MNIIEIFHRLGPDEKHPCLFWSNSEDGWQKRLAWNPVAHFTGAKEDLEDFVNEHRGKFIVGYLSYDFELCFFVYDSFLEESSKLTEEIEDILERSLVENEISLKLEPELNRAQYDSAFKKIKDYIVSGDIYQMNLTMRFEAEFAGDPKALFQRVIQENPVDFMVYLDVSSDLQILSASPERFIQTKGDMIHSYPIKGTRPRGLNEEEDENERRALLDNEKEKAELNMITDLLRNDMGKIAKTGTVKVVEHRTARAFTAIWHTYSHIEGELAVSPIQALLSMSPGGSITGCPKIRAMEVIEELELHKRGIYTGSIGFIEPNGDVDFNIAIRTFLKTQNILHLQVGGGIVYDSEADSEWEEIFNKAKPFLLL